MIDPHSENYYSWSPYVYVANNPMRLIDPDGRSYTDYVDKNGVRQVKTNDATPDRIETTLPEVVVEGKAETKSSSEDYVGFSITGTAAIVTGVTGELSVGIYPEDGIAIQVSIGTTVGVDVSGTVSFKQGKYTGTGPATAESMNGLSEGISIGAGAFSVGKDKDIVNTGTKDKYNETIFIKGENWNVRSVGISLGSKTTVGGNTHRTYTFPPLKYIKNENKKILLYLFFVSSNYKY